MNPSTQTSAITRWTLVRVFWRSFFLQAANNYERMQNIGFAYCMMPALRKLYRGDDLKQAAKRHLEFFNTHPYLAASLLGASILIEEEIAAGTRSADDVRTFKRVMMGPMAAIGDSFFWSSLRPFAAIWAVMGILSGLWWAPLGFLILFNGCHLGIRIYGIVAGYRHGHGVCDRINRLALVRFAEQTHYLAALFVGATAAILSDQAAHSAVALTDGLEPFLIFALILIFLLGLKRGFPMVSLLYGAVVTTLTLVIALNVFFPLA